MNFLEKTYIHLITKSGDLVRSKDGSFEFKMPTGFRYKESKGMFQIVDPYNKGFLFQWSGIVLKDDIENEFNIDDELKKELAENPSAEIQTTGSYDCVCSATKSEDGKTIVYKWKIGERNKRILATLILDGKQHRNKIDELVNRAGRLLNELKIKHAT